MPRSAPNEPNGEEETCSQNRHSQAKSSKACHQAKVEVAGQVPDDEKQLNQKQGGGAPHASAERVGCCAAKHSNYVACREALGKAVAICVSLW